MSYVKTTWVTGDIVTAPKLNNIENGVYNNDQNISSEASTRATADGKLEADLAPAYSTSATYAVGDYCIYQGQLYRCTTAITTAEAWTSGHWSAVALGDDTSDLRSALTSFEDEVKGTGVNIDSLDGFSTYNANMGSSGTWSSVGSSDYQYSIIPIPQTGCTLSIKGSVYGTYYAGLKTYTQPTSYGQTADLSDTWNARRSAPSTGETVSIPNDVTVLLVWTKFSNTDFTPESFSITKAGTSGLLDTKQDTLISGENIKTINGTSILGSGDISTKETEPTDFMLMFKRIAVIGDSLASGELTWLDDNPEGGTWKPSEQKYYHGVDIYDNSWLAYICDTMEATPVYYASGGKSTTSWWLEYADALTTDTPSNAYIIALGTNDANEVDFAVGTAADATTANTYSGRIKKIIELIRTTAPYAAIFLMSMYNDQGTNPKAINLVLPDIASLYDMCYFVDFAHESDIVKTTKDNDYASEYHFTTNGYLRVARNIKRIINEVIDTNQTDFKFFALHNFTNN